MSWDLGTHALSGSLSVCRLHQPVSSLSRELNIFIRIEVFCAEVWVLCRVVQDLHRMCTLLQCLQKSGKWMGLVKVSPWLLTFRCLGLHSGEIPEVLVHLLEKKWKRELPLYSHLCCNYLQRCWAVSVHAASPAVLRFEIPAHLTLPCASLMGWIREILIGKPLHIEKLSSMR